MTFLSLLYIMYLYETPKALPRGQFLETALTICYHEIQSFFFVLSLTPTLVQKSTCSLSCFIVVDEPLTPNELIYVHL